MKNLLFFFIATAIFFSCKNKANDEASVKFREPYDHEVVNAKTWMMVEPKIMNLNCYEKDAYYVVEAMFSTIPEAAFNIIEKKSQGQRIEIYYNQDVWLVNVFDYCDYKELSITDFNELVKDNNVYIKDGLPVKKITCFGSHGFLSLEYEPEIGKTIVYFDGDKWKVLKGSTDKFIGEFIAERDSLMHAYQGELNAIKDFFESL